ncbi:hypothetical protein WA158_005942 [Blastocystis sp. Blastoise]
MLDTEFQLTEDKYLFTFQDETQLWISREFIEKYQQLPFYGIIKHSGRYEDGSYYIDIHSSSMKIVIHFLMEEKIDIFSLNLKDSYDIYKTLTEYSVTIDKEIQSDLFIHIKDLFYNYLNEKNYDVYNFNAIRPCMPIELYNIEEKKIYINGLITSQRKEELLYYSLLFKMMNITRVEITYDYASNIPIEYICPSCIQDIFPSLEKLIIYLTTHYKKTQQLLNPNSDEYIMEYIRLFSELDYEIENPEEYDYYTELEMNEYNKISSLDRNKIYYSHKLINSYNEKKEKNELPKLYRYVVNEAIYTNDYSKVEISKTEDEYTLNDQVIIKYDDKTKDKTFIIDKVYTEHGISQLLRLLLLSSFSKIVVDLYIDTKYESIIIINAFEEGVFDCVTILNISWIKKLINKINKKLFNKIMTTHVFPNVTELIYDDDDNNEYSDYDYDDSDNDDYNDATDNFEFLLPVSLISIIDTIRINNIDSDKEEEIALRLDELVYTHSIIIDIINIYKYDLMNYFPHLKELIKKNLIIFDYLYIDSSRSKNIEKLDSIDNYKQHIDSLNITFYNNYPDEIDLRNSLKRFLKSNILEHLNNLVVKFDENISIECLTWISTLFSDNKFNNIHELTINLYSIPKASSSEYLTAYENILEKIIPKSFIVNIEGCTMTFINRFIPKGCFHNTTQLILNIKDIPDENFCKLYTTNNFPQLKYIKIYTNGNEWWISFIKIFCNYINSNNYPSSSIIRLSKHDFDYYYDYIYNPDTSIFPCKYDTNSFIDTIIDTENETISRYEIETLFECINENKTQHIRSLKLYIYDEEQLSKLISFITTGKFPKLKEFLFVMHYISQKRIGIYKQQLNDSSFIKENHVNYHI